MARDVELKVLTRLEAIRAKCLDCSDNSKHRVRTCPIKHCALWPYRMGKNPNRKGVGGNPQLKGGFGVSGGGGAI